VDTDLITLTGLRVHGRHGVFDHEREAGQDFIVDVSLRTSTREAAASDDLKHTVDYGALADTLADIVAGEPVNLIETLAERLADACLALDRVASAVVTVHKPQAPIAQQFSDVAVTIERPHRAARELRREEDSA
jgi:dihydroneopterin aldolase